MKNATLEELRLEVAQEYYKIYNFEDFPILGCHDWNSQEDVFSCGIKVADEDYQDRQNGTFKVIFCHESTEVLDAVAEYRNVEFGYLNVPFEVSIKPFS